jgi:hypothetical protein
MKILEDCLRVMIAALTVIGLGGAVGCSETVVVCSAGGCNDAGHPVTLEPFTQSSVDKIDLLLMIDN